MVHSLREREKKYFFKLKNALFWPFVSSLLPHLHIQKGKISKQTNTFVV
jgi:hypothetical protein